MATITKPKDDLLVAVADEPAVAAAAHRLRKLDDRERALSDERQRLAAALNPQQLE